MNFKDLKLQIKDVKDDGQFEGYCSTFGNEDLGGDIVAPGAFTKTIKDKKDHPILWGHNAREVIGVNQKYTEDSKGLYVQGQLVLDVQRAKEAHALMKAGAVKGMSIGYDVVVDEYNRDTNIRTLKELKLWEYSLTPFPMNPEATVTTVKSLEEFENALRLAMKTATDAEKRALMDKAEKTISALRAAIAPEAAKQDDFAPEKLHAEADRITKLLQGAN